MASSITTLAGMPFLNFGGRELGEAAELLLQIKSYIELGAYKHTNNINMYFSYKVTITDNNICVFTKI